jgi:phosphohistidine phosphatase
MATLELYLVRHGVAAERGDEYPDDSKRPLTRQGIARLRKEAQALETLGAGFDHIIASPLVRTKQTADVLAQHMTSRPSVSTSDSLAPAGTPAAVLHELGKHMRKPRIALVGHEPNIGELAARLIGSRVPLDFKKGAVCRIDFEVFPPKGTGHLRWFVTPKMLRKIGGH